MLQWITPEDALLSQRCKRLLLEKAGPRGENEGGSTLLERQMEAELHRLREFVFAQFAGELKRIDTVDTEAALRESGETLLGEGAPRSIVDPVFRWGRFLARPDLIRYSSKEAGWTVYMVRPATGVRGAYLDEAAMLLLILKRSGLSVASLRLLYLDKGYTREGELDAASLIKESDLTRRGEKRQRHALKLLQVAEALITGEEELAHAYRCEMPGACSVCREEIAALPKHNILTLARGGREARELYLNGVESILELPETHRLSRRQSIQIAAVRENVVQIDDDRLQAFLARLAYPRVYLDFEAFSTGIPPVDGVGPFEHIPYLFSVHRQEARGAPIENGTFVMEPGRDQRVDMFRELLRWTGESGSLVVFSAAFESAMIRQLARRAELPDQGELLIEGIVDLLEPFNEFTIYHPEQLGKVSMKRIVPIFTEESYEELDVQDGLEANVAYGELFDRFRSEVISPDRYPQPAGTEDPDSVLSRLEAYCIQDTSGMVRLVEELEALSDHWAG